MSAGTMLVAGATGIVGVAAIEHFGALPDWRVLAVSRRAPPSGAPCRHVPLDLTDRDACMRAATAFGDVTHVMYAALYEKTDLLASWRDDEQMEVNLTMLRNLVDALESSARGLRHITILQGTKAYGLHDEQVPVPAKERWPRRPHKVFYWPQEDLLRQRQPGSGWTFTVLRPQIILGHAVGSPMNVIAAIGAYAAIMRELGRPLSFPGGGRYVHAASDSRLIARAAEFAGAHEVAANETYNVVNGDMLVWQDVWASIAQHFGMPVGDPRPLRLAEAMPAFEDVWSALVSRHGLQRHTLASLLGSSWQFTDRTFCFGIDDPLDRIASPIKLWQAGFAACEDTEDSIRYWLSRMQRAKLLPDWQTSHTSSATSDQGRSTEDS